MPELSTSSCRDVSFRQPPVERSNHVWQAVFQAFNADEQTVYHSRRPHKKSRAGCITCKRRRVKCDEKRPCCLRCQKYGATCSYDSSAASRRMENSKAVFVQEKPSEVAFSMSLRDMETRINEVLDSCGGIKPHTLKEQDASYPISVIALQHFIKHSTEHTPIPSMRNVMRTDMIRVGFTSPYLMYTILGVGLLHLNRVSPGSHLRRLAEAHFWQQAISLYQKALNTNVSQDNIDAILSACIFMGITSLCPENFSPTDSWVLTNKPGAMNWLCLQCGLRCILGIARPYVASSIWAIPFADTAREEFDMFDCGSRTGRDGLDPDMADLCGVDDFTTEATNPYYAPLTYISELSKLEKNATNASICTSFMGRLDHDFLALLRERDVPALIILSHWMGMMCSMSQWQPWVEGRIRAECIAICIYLENTTDLRIQRLLEFPAESCGYNLRWI
ncbi:hypothetical protein BDV59DRAFT_121934 [Aspergillus ambiguus]|uniref:Zn(II)2Cys6 transcription factor n=1 Tax=Aspergillus ambiguus TaxID=176160 RepID=UPI003CCE529E